jgi:peptidoglycan/LPS O-acetylase OafA/YrhL
MDKVQEVMRSISERPHALVVRLKGTGFPYITFQSKLARSNKYRPEIDGLRALAVLSVLFFHANVAGFSGGFVGVDVFFVISGYLITSIITPDIAMGRFSFVSFYERRIRRIFPALFAVVFFSILAAGILLAPKDFAAFGRSLLAMTFFVSNIFFKREAGTSYFDRTSDSQPLLHTWSLSVEEQFYLFLPAALILLARWAKRRRIEYLWLGVIISFFMNVWGTVYRPQSAFYILIPRAWELLIGALLAMKAVPVLKQRVSREITGLVGLGLIAWAVFVFTRDTIFPGFNAFLPCLGAWLIIYAGQNGPSIVRTILSLRPFVFIGVISYSLYLWHWPIIVFGKYFSAGALNARETVGAIILSLVMGFISFEFIESPFRGGDSPVKRRQIFSFGLTASALAATAGFMIYSHQGYPGRYNDSTKQLVLSNTDRKSDYQEVCSNWRRSFSSIDDIQFCNIGSTLPKKIMFWGDSHVQQLYPLVRKIYDTGGLGQDGVVFAIAAGCPPTEHMNGDGFHCDSFTRFAMMRAEEEDIDTVFLGFTTWWSTHEWLCPSVEGRCVGKISTLETRQRFLEELSRHIQMLRARGKRVIVSLPFPFFDKSIPDLEIRNAVFRRFGLAGVATEGTLPSFRDQLASVAERMGADTFDPRKSLCPDQKCITSVDGVSIYKDESHIAASQIGILEGNMERVLR